MPVKFKESAKVLVNRVSKKYKTVNYYMHATSTDVLVEALAKGNTRGPRKQKIANELVRRGVL